MLLVMDVGNTNITVGAFEREKLVATFRMTTKLPRTSDEYGMIIRNLLVNNGISPNSINNVALSSVVPNVMHSLTSALIKYFDVMPAIIDAKMAGMKIDALNPEQIGADRLVDAVGAYEIYGGPALVLDYGTATTYDLISKEGCFMAGVTSPGVRICAKALWEDAAKLPEIEIKKPESILAKETISSMQAGLVYGQIGQTEYIIRLMKKESGYEGIKVIATGGLGKMIANETDCIDIYDPNLTLQGIRLIFEKNKKKA